MKVLEARELLCCGSMERELHISRKVIQELLKVPKALMEIVANWTDLNCFFGLVRRVAYRSFFNLNKRQF